MSGQEAPIKIGNALPAAQHSRRLHDSLHRNAARARVLRWSVPPVLSPSCVAREGAYAQIRLRSGEVRRVLIECRATIGTVGNEENSLRELGKAGAKRWRGVRPTVRGVAMNPVDHPHGGGEGQVPVPVALLSRRGASSRRATVLATASARTT